MMNLNKAISTLQQQSEYLFSIHQMNEKNALINRDKDRQRKREGLRE